jgi:hypothetical protein
MLDGDRLLVFTSLVDNALKFTHREVASGESLREGWLGAG